MDVERPFQRADLGGIAHQGTVVGDENGGGGGGHGIHGALPFLPVRGGDGNGFPLLEGTGFHIQGKKAVHRQLRKAAVRIHDIGHIVVHLGVDGLDPSGHTGLDGGADGIPAGGLQVVVQIVHAVLDGG